LSWPGIAVRKNGVLKNAYVPAIHVLSNAVEEDADGRDKPGYDEERSNVDSDVFGSGERRWIVL